MSNNIKARVIELLSKNQDNGFNIINELYGIDRESIMTACKDDFTFGKTSLATQCEHAIYINSGDVIDV